MQTVVQIDAAPPAQSKPPRPVTDVIGGLLGADVGRGIVVAASEQGARMIAAALQAANPDAAIVLCPAGDALPGDSAPSSPANVGARLAALRGLRRAIDAATAQIVLVTTGEACAQRYPHPGDDDPTLRVGREQPLAPDAVPTLLEAMGYWEDDRVDEPGEYKLHGQVVEVYPADQACPVRIEIRDGVVGELRRFDPVTQRALDTVETIDTVEIGRASEPTVADGVVLLDHLPGAAVYIEDGAEARRRAALALAADAARRGGRPAADRFADDDLWTGAFAARPRLMPAPAAEPPPRFVEADAPLRRFRQFARDTLAKGKTLVLLGTPRDLRFLVRRAETALQRQCIAVASWAEAVAAPGGSLVALAMPLPRGFALAGIVAVSAADLLGSRAERGDAGDAVGPVQAFTTGDVKVGDVVVHEAHGVAVIEGIETLPAGGDAIVLRHAGDTRRLVPIEEAGRIWRYGAEADAVTLDKLDGSSWEKRRAELDPILAETARELTRLAAERAAATAPVLVPDPADYERFVAGFPFGETADQARAIEAVRVDLASGRPMDRLVIGDVGFGKTEVALRAAAMTALAGHQVAVAAPTTVLARQHYESFARRFASTGVTVAALSRFSTPAEKRAVKAGLADGTIGIVVGTGGVAGKDVRYARPGLVIIDEEQRFGAADKARLRALGAGHLLTLSATPIPRTLQNALIGLQPMSIIATPPARRQPILTSVATFDDAMVRGALLRERARGGQSFVVVPRIEDLAPLQARLAGLVPELEMIAVHGKLPAAELDTAMVRFADGEGDVLLATNIIEAGLDVPRANTMIVWRADRFGLAQLHQLRGRVGRGSRRGRVVLLTDADRPLAPRTLARLGTLAAHDRLGAGFAISARDLDLRGAGDLLGDDQAGHARLIGVDLYQHLLAKALQAARGETVDDWMPVLNLGCGGSLPADWIASDDQRITLYMQLARHVTADAVDTFQEELADRFGEIPDPARRLLDVARLRLLAKSVGIERVDAGPAAIALTSRATAAAQFAELGFVESNGRQVLKGDFDDDGTRLARLEEVLRALSPAADGA